MKLETLIEQNYHKLSENDLHIWRYIHAHPAACRDISIDRLAAACNISHTTILRFSKKLGLAGFSELKMILKWQELGADAFGADEIERSVQDYQQTLEYLRTVDFSDLFTLLDHANQVYIYGSGTVQTLAARSMKQNFFTVNKLFHTIEGEDEMRRLIGRLHEDDVMVFISLSGNNAFMNEMAERLKQAGRTIISITRIQSNRLIYLSDIHIPFFTHAVHTGSQVEFWLTNQLFLINEFLILKYMEYRSRRRLSSPGKDETSL